jgi:hypothetical protein
VSVLVTERDLQVKDLLAVALEAEMPRLDDSRVHRADRDLVNRVALDAEEVGDARRERRARARAVPRLVVTDRFHPGMAFGVHSELLGDLALEEVRLGAVGSQRLERVAR